MSALGWLHPLLALALAPLLPGVIHRTKALFAGRSGPPLLQGYHDLLKLARKGAVHSRTTTWVFRLGPVAALSAVGIGLLLLPMGSIPAAVSFPGDFVAFVYLLALARFVTVLAALDTGSSFEGMGGSREVAFAALAEPALLLCLAAAAREAGQASLTGIAAGMSGSVWVQGAPALLLVAVALLAVLLAENARIPVDDPNTHLELTMIHEAMVLDHGGPDLALIHYGSALKLWSVGALLVGVVLPIHTGHAFSDTAIFLAGVVAAALAVGIIESSIARLRLIQVPQFLVGAGAFAVLALALAMR
ncbi:MAG TPA: NADH-quinone oxidoreductase subunit H [Candidatus Eisenbacteria bacterium]|jgi:formate hydrogenlyase subunit 4